MKGRVSSCCVLLLTLGVLLFGGCRSPLRWLGFGGRHDASNGMAYGGRSAAASDSVLQEPASISAGVRADDLRIIGIIFDVVRIDMPVEGQRHSRKIWNHVDELRVDPEVVKRMARNGLRVGAASKSAWPAIRAVLDAADADVRREQLVAEPGLPLSISLASVVQPESVFSYTGDGRLVGKTFPAGEKVLDIDYAFHPRLGGCTDLQLSFEIRHDRGVMTWEKHAGIIRQVPDYDRHVFAEVGVLLTLKPEEFLVVGLNDEARNEYLVGGRFLINERAGKRYETMLFVTPQPYQTGG